MLRIIFCVFTLPLRFLYWANYFGLTTGHCLPLSTLLLPVGNSYKFKQIAMPLLSFKVVQFRDLLLVARGL